MDVSFEADGPLFNRGAGRRVSRAITTSEREVGEHLVKAVRTRLNQVLVNPTGHYSSRIDFAVRRDSTLVTDSGVVYGPWLEGTSSRNRTTRFKGYSTFRKVMAEAQSKVSDIVGDEVAQAVKELS